MNGSASNLGVRIVGFPHYNLRFLFTLSIPPTWRRGVMLSSVTSLHLKCRPADKTETVLRVLEKFGIFTARTIMASIRNILHDVTVCVYTPCIICAVIITHHHYPLLTERSRHYTSLCGQLLLLQPRTQIYTTNVNKGL